MKRKEYLIFILFFIVGMLSDCSPKEGQTSDSVKPGRINAIKEGNRIRIKAYIPRGYTQFEMRITSDRNEPVSRVSKISPHDKDSAYRKERFSDTDTEIWYPVVDVKLEQGMDAVCIFDGNPEGWYIFGGPYYRESLPLEKKLILPAHKLEYWENSLQVESREFEIQKFYLRRTFPVILREFSHEFELLSPDWGGTISIWGMSGNKLTQIASTGLPRKQPDFHAVKAESLKGSGISRERLITALDLLIQDGARRQNLNPASPMYGSLFLFYDLEARLHRTDYWTWGGSQYVKMALDAMKVPEIRSMYSKDKMVEILELIGKVYLRYQVREEGHPSRGSFLVIWSRGHKGYTKWVGTSDSGVIIRWALIPLFMATGDSKYLEAAEFWCAEKAKILDTVDILPHYYLYDEDRFNPGILDETGWDPEGHASLYEVTGKEEYRESARLFMDKHMKVFQREDGLWQRNYNWVTGKTGETARMVRGCGWAMEGLLAMNRMYPDSIYLEYAIRMANHLVENQHPDGSWSFVFNLEPEDTGITEKGTALWSLLFYQLYDATGNEKYLETARYALIWCLDNQYTGPDPEAVGGLVGRTNASMVGIRHYYDATCAYTTGFFGLAILEELKNK